jgi:hypothetical protein
MMAYDYEDDSSRSQNPAKQAQPSKFVSLNYKLALATWFVPVIVVGLVMAAINLRSYDTVMSLNYANEEDFLRTEQRTARGWPYVLASVERATSRWSLNTFGIVVDGIIALAAMIITAGTSRFFAAFVDNDVNMPLQTQMQRLLRGNSRKAAPQRSAPSSRKTGSGPPRVRRRSRPVDE